MELHAVYIHQTININWHIWKSISFLPYIKHFFWIPMPTWRLFRFTLAWCWFWWIFFTLPVKQQCTSAKPVKILEVWGFVLFFFTKQMGELKSSGRMEPSTDVLQSSCSFSEQSEGVVDEATVMLPERGVVWKCDVFASSGQQVGGDLQGKTRMNVRTVSKQYFKIKWKKNIQTRTLLRAAQRQEMTLTWHQGRKPTVLFLWRVF